MADVPKVGINGFGRIGRLVARALLEMEDSVELVAVNDLTTPETLAHLFKYDSIHGRFPGKVEVDGNKLVLGDQDVRVLSEKDPGELPWGEMDVDYVVESTGRFTSRDGLQKHLDAGAKRVILSAPGKDVDVTLVRGVNMHMYKPDEHRIISNASCTTNCLAPVLKVLHEAFGVKQACMTTIHAYTNDQHLLDSPHKDLRRARAAAMSMIPTSTGAARAINLVIPELEGKVDGMAVRVPLSNGSLVDVSASLGRHAEKEEIADAFHKAAEEDLKDILAVEEQPLVSADFNHDPHSAVVDVPGTMLVDHALVKIIAWYDNEWGYANRTAELVMDVWNQDHPEISATAPRSR